MYLAMTMLVSLAGMSASAMDLSWLAPFLYEGSSYVPLKSTANFLGAPLRWDAENGQAVITYNGEDFVLTPNSPKAVYAGQAVVLSSPPVVLNGVTYVPIETFKKYYGVPVTWDGAKSEVKIKGASGWRTMKASSRPPWHGGPPPWAPAWGLRGHEAQGHPSYGKANGKANGNEKIKVKSNGKGKGNSNSNRKNH